VILAAGEGKRLKKYFPDLPKPLISVKNRPLISYTLDKIITSGLKEIYVVINSEHEQKFKQILKNYTLKYIYQKKAEGTAKALLSVHKVITGDFLLSYCDLITSFNYKRLIKFHKKYRPFATLVVKKDARRDNEILIENDKVIKIVEKPQISFSEFTAIGIMCLSKKIFKYLRQVKRGRTGEYNLTDALNISIHNREVVRAIPTRARRVNFNIPEGTF
jgi:glucose-1-phosphate thymidylyltransferase